MGGYPAEMLDPSTNSFLLRKLYSKRDINGVYGSSVLSLSLSLSLSLFIFFCVNIYILKTIMKKQNRNIFMFFVSTSLDKIYG